MLPLKQRVITHEEISAMPPGGDLNALIAINVGKWHRKGAFSVSWYTDDGFRIADTFEPSRSLDDCFKVCRNTDWHVYLERQGDEPGTERWTARVIVAYPTFLDEMQIAESGPLALSRALLTVAKLLLPGNFVFEEDFQRIPERTKKIYIFDLDGTIALIDHRRHWLDKSQHEGLSLDERWRNFFADCVSDEPNWPVIETLTALYNSGTFKIIIFSGRSNEVREQTVEWLRRHRVPYQELRMRQEGDFTPDEELKQEWLGEMEKSQIVAVFDDRDKVVGMWRGQGVGCFQVAPGDF